MTYRGGPPFRVRPVADIEADLQEARALYGRGVRTLFLPAGNTIAMPAEDLAAVCRFARRVFSGLERITVYGSAPYLRRKTPLELRQLAEAGLSRIHMGLESGEDEVLARIRKGANSRQQIEAGQAVQAAGMELSLYVILGIGGRERSLQHARETARVLNRIHPDFVRLRTFVPKIRTPLLNEIRAGRFEMLGPHGVLRETAALLGAIEAPTRLASDHYTNYINLEGRLPQDRQRLLTAVDTALARDESTFRPFFIGTQ
jgi:radical SAM superfamily enzyme YgiQ (UPF0313 family)